MADYLRDPLNNAVQNGIKEDISVAFEHQRWRAGLILIYAGMDAMAYLDMPDGEDEVAKIDFIRWADRYMRFPCIEQVKGADFYGARCAMLHSYGAISRLSRDGKCRVIGYMDKGIPEVQHDPAINKNLVLVSLIALKTAFFDAVDSFLVAAFSDKVKSLVVERRLPHLTLVLPFDPDKGQVAE